MKRVKVSMGKWYLRCLLIFTLVFSFTAALPIIQLHAAERYERKRIEISTDPVIEPTESNKAKVSVSSDGIIAEGSPLSDIVRKGYMRVRVNVSSDLDPSPPSQNFIAQLLDPLIGYEVREFKRVHPISMGSDKAKVSVSSDGIVYKSNNLSDTVDLLDLHKGEGFEPVETIDLGRIPVTIEVTISSGSILVDLVGRDPEPDPAPEQEPETEEAPAPGPVAGP